MNIEELQVLKEKYEKSLNEQLVGCIYKESEMVQLVNIIGNDFVNIINQELKLKSFNMRTSKTMNILLFTIISEEKNLVNILISTNEISKNVLKIEEIQVDSLIDEDFLKNLCE